jgi:hypothetical protein
MGCHKLKWPESNVGLDVPFSNPFDGHKPLGRPTLKKTVANKPTSRSDSKCKDQGTEDSRRAFHFSYPSFWLSISIDEWIIRFHLFHPVAGQRLFLP